MKLIITENFYKNLSKVKSINLDNIVNLVKRIPNTNKLVEIDSFVGFKVFKGYLLSKKVRTLILFEAIENNIIPMSVVRKETKKGYNITKENYLELFGNDIDKGIDNYKKGLFEEINL